MPARGNAVLRKLDNCATTAPSEDLCPLVKGSMKALLKTGGFMQLKSAATLDYSYSMHMMCRISDFLTRHSISLQLNKRFSTLNNAGVLFLILFPYRATCEHLDFV